MLLAACDGLFFFCCLCFMSLFIGSVYTDQMDLELGFQKAYSAPSG